MTERKRRCRSGQYRDLRQSLPPHDEQAGQHAAGKATEPAHAASAEEEISERLFAKVLDHPQQLRTGQSADDARDGSVQALGGQGSPTQFSLEDPETGQRTDCDQHTKAGDLEAADPENYRIHRLMPLCGPPGGRVPSLAI